MKLSCIFLMGLMAFGKIVLVVELVKYFFMDIISVDFVLIYKGMDIGIVKLDVGILVVVLYCLISFLDLAEIYFVVDFCRDVL